MSCMTKQTKNKKRCRHQSEVLQTCRGRSRWNSSMGRHQHTENGWLQSFWCKIHKWTPHDCAALFLLAVCLSVCLSFELLHLKSMRPRAPRGLPQIPQTFNTLGVYRSWIDLHTERCWEPWWRRYRMVVKRTRWAQYLTRSVWSRLRRGWQGRKNCSSTVSTGQWRAQSRRGEAAQLSEDWRSWRGRPTGSLWSRANPTRPGLRLTLPGLGRSGRQRRCQSSSGSEWGRWEFSPWDQYLSIHPSISENSKCKEKNHLEKWI